MVHLRNPRLGEPKPYVSDAIGPALLHQRSLVPLGLADLKRQIDQRNQHRNAADKASQRRKVGK
jgi:hypothetical protein